MKERCLPQHALDFKNVCLFEHLDIGDKVEKKRNAVVNPGENAMVLISNPGFIQECCLLGKTTRYSEFFFFFFFWRGSCSMVTYIVY